MGRRPSARRWPPRPAWATPPRRPSAAASSQPPAPTSAIMTRLATTTPAASRCTSGSATASARPRSTNLGVLSRTSGPLRRRARARRAGAAPVPGHRRQGGRGRSAQRRRLVPRPPRRLPAGPRVLPPGTGPEHGSRRTAGSRAAAWDSLGYAEHHLGNLAEAAACYQRALSLYRESGDRFREADTLTHLGDTRHAAGDLAQAREAWQQALAILEDLQHPDAGQVRAKLCRIQVTTVASGPARLRQEPRPA